MAANLFIAETGSNNLPQGILAIHVRLPNQAVGVPGDNFLLLQFRDADHAGPPSPVLLPQQFYAVSSARADRDPGFYFRVS